MSKIIQSCVPVGSRQKIYLILVCVSLILLFYSVWQVSYVIVSAEDILGLVNHLTPAYWIGLSLLTITSILVLLDLAVKKDALFIVILFAVGLFLVVLPAFIYENPTENANFYPFSEINNWLPTHHLGINNPPHFASYYSWPGFHFLSASIVMIWGESFDFFEFAKYIPIFFLFCFILITYSIGKRLDLEPNSCFLLSFLSLSSWLLITADYAPRSIGMILFLLLFLLLLTPKKTVGNSILAILLFVTIVLTHSLTALAALPAIVMLAFYRRDYRFVALFIVIFGTWYMYQAVGVLELGVRQALTYPIQQIFIVSQQEYAVGTTSITRIVSHDAWLSYGALYFALLLGSIILLLRRGIAVERRKQIISAFAWSIGAAIVTVAVGFADAFQRTYVFALVPAACIIVLSFPYMLKRATVLVIILMCLFVGLHIPAEYGEDASWGIVLTSDVKGAEFLAHKVNPTESYFYSGNTMLVHYYNPGLIKIPIYYGAVIDPWESKIDITALDRLHYVVISKKGTDRAIFRWGKDPYALWPQTEAGQRADLIYNNGDFQVYENRLIE